MGKMKLYTKLMTTALLAGLAVSAFAQDNVTAKATLTKPVRLGNTTDYTTKPFFNVETWLTSGDPQGYYCPTRFDLSSVKQAVGEGKVVKSAKLRLTHYSGTGIKLGVRPFSTEWNASSTSSDLKTLVETYKSNETVATLDYTFTNLMTDVVTSTGVTSGTYNIADYQVYVDVTDYVKANTSADELNVLLSRYDYNGGNAYKGQLWSANVNTSNKGDGNYKTYWDDMLTAFSLNADEFIEAVTPTIEVELTTPANSATTTGTATADCYVRDNAVSNAYGTTEQVETWNGTTHSYGLMAFDVPEAVSFKDLTTVSSATLRLVTRKIGNGNYTNMSIYAYGNDFTEKSTYNDEQSYVTSALEGTAITTFDMKGQGGKALSDGNLNTANQTLDAWTNTVDITSYISENVNSTRLNLMLKPTQDSDSKNYALHIYSRDAKDKKLNNTIDVAAADLVPQLTVSYTVGYKLTVGAAKAATLCLPYEATIPADVKVYKLGSVGSNGVVATEEVTGTIAPNTPVLVMAEAGDYNFDAADPNVKSATATNGVLTGVYEETTVPEGSYILSYKDNKLAFRKSDGSTNKVKAYRAYLTNSNSSAKTLTLDLDGEATAISNVKANATLDGKSYNLAGQRATKGLLIKNGKKYIVK